MQTKILKSFSKITIVLFSFVIGASLVSAQSPAPKTAPAALPSPGLTPASPFFFLDRFSENIRELLTFSLEAKAQLQTQRQAERISELNSFLSAPRRFTIVEPAVKTSFTLIEEHKTRANQLIDQLGAQGRDVKGLANTIDDAFDANEEALEEVFEEAEEALEARERDVKRRLREARLAGDQALISQLQAELRDIKAQEEALDQQEEELEDALEALEDQIEEELEAEEKRLEELEDQREEEEERLEEELEEAREQEEELLEELEEAAKDQRERLEKELEKARERIKDLEEND